MAQIGVEHILGLKEKIGNPLELIVLGAKGVSKSQIGSLSKAMCLSLATIANLLAVSLRTIQRQPEGKVFDRNVSERAIKLAQLTAHGVNVFGAKEEFCAWLQTPVVALGNKTPMSILNSTMGVELVDNIVGRIEHGIFS